MLLRELVGGDPPYTMKLIFLDDPAAFGHRVMDGERVVEHVLTKYADFEQAVTEKLTQGFAETERSQTRRVFVTADRFWIVALDSDTVRTQTGSIRENWREASGHARNKEYRDRNRAVSAYHTAITDKQLEGYRELYARTVVIAEVPRGAKKPGKRKSR